MTISARRRPRNSIDRSPSSRRQRCRCWPGRAANRRRSSRRYVLAVQSVDPEQPIFAVQTMSSILFGDTSGSRIIIAVLGVFAGLALVLAAVGIYGVVSYAAAQRTREVGIRMALGASTRDVIRLILRQAMVPVAAGMAVGLLLSLAMTRLIAGILFQVSPTDPVTFSGVTLLLGGVGLVASLVPALRAGRRSSRSLRCGRGNRGDGRRPT